MRRLLPRLEALFVWYAATVALLSGTTVSDTIAPGSWWVLGHVAVGLGLILWRPRRRVARWALACVLVPCAFTSLGVFIGDLVPRPAQFDVRALDVAIGGDWLRAALADPPVLLVELCQLCYASFYFLPLLLALRLARQGRSDEVEELAVLVVGSFLFSYLCYCVAPTLPPYRFCEWENELSGGPAFALLDPLLRELEGLEQDCMPSGHCWITLVVCWFAWKRARHELWWLAPISAFLLLGTVLLRLHWPVDLYVALPLAGLSARLFGTSVSGGLAPAIAGTRACQRARR